LQDIATCLFLDAMVGLVKLLVVKTLLTDVCDTFRLSNLELVGALLVMLIACLLFEDTLSQLWLGEWFTLTWIAECLDWALTLTGESEHLNPAFEWFRHFSSRWLLARLTDVIWTWVELTFLGEHLSVSMLGWQLLAFTLRLFFVEDLVILGEFFVAKSSVRVKQDWLVLFMFRLFLVEHLVIIAGCLLLNEQEEMQSWWCCLAAKYSFTLEKELFSLELRSFSEQWTISLTGEQLILGGIGGGEHSGKL
jgi:hypothetical protein